MIWFHMGKNDSFILINSGIMVTDKGGNRVFFLIFKMWALKQLNEVLWAETKSATLKFFLFLFFSVLQTFNSWQNWELTTHSSLVSEKYTGKERDENNMEWNAWHVLGHKITSNETAIYGLVKNIWICKLKNRASGKASCLGKNTLFVAILNHFF